MISDPGWLQAIPLIPTALFARTKLLSERPALVAARAGTLAWMVAGPIMVLLVVSLGLTIEPDFVLTGFIVGGTAALAAFGIFKLRDGRLEPAVANSDPATLFIGHAGVLTAMATVPQLSAFVCYFLGGGVPVTVFGVVTSWILLLGPARPGRALVESVATRMVPPLKPEVLWDLVAAPEVADVD